MCTLEWFLYRKRNKSLLLIEKTAEVSFQEKLYRAAGMEMFVRGYEQDTEAGITGVVGNKKGDQG